MNGSGSFSLPWHIEILFLLSTRAEGSNFASGRIPERIYLYPVKPRQQGVRPLFYFGQVDKNTYGTIFTLTHAFVFRDMDNAVKGPSIRYLQRKFLIFWIHREGPQ